MRKVMKPSASVIEHIGEHDDAVYGPEKPRVQVDAYASDEARRLCEKEKDTFYVITVHLIWEPVTRVVAKDRLP